MNKHKVKAGINVEPIAGATGTEKGDITYNSTSNQLQIYTSSEESITTATNTQTLTNKTITGGTISGGTFNNATFTGTTSFPGASSIDTSGNLTIDGVFSTSSNIATTGFIRMASAEAGVVFRNNANTGNVALAKNTSDALTWNGSAFITSAGGLLSGTVVSGSGTLTINTSGNITVPNGTDTLVSRTSTDTGTNRLQSKDLDTSTVRFVDGSDTSKKIIFSASGNTSGTTLTLTSATTSSRVLTFPDATDTLVGKATTDTLTNKTISSGTFTGTSSFPSSTSIDGSGHFLSTAFITANTGSTPSSGLLRLGSSEAIVWRNNGNSGDVSLAKNSSDQLTFGGNVLVPLTTKGDLLGFSTINARVPVGANGTVLTADSTQALGVKWASSLSSPVAPTIQRFTTGSGTYTTPTSPAPLYLKITLVGGGGGGGNGGNITATNGTAGGNTTFGTATVGGGGGGLGQSQTPGSGGTVSATIGSTIYSQTGNDGHRASAIQTLTLGGAGGSGFLGGTRLEAVQAGSAQAPVDGSGSGGGGGGGNGSFGAGSGGGAGANAVFLVGAPSATYSYSVGAGGAGGATGASQGSSGAAGLIVVEEYYQ